MRIVGIVASAAVALIVLTAVLVFLLSLPDLARYRRLRKM
jgi:hypothetical protein